MHELSNVVHQAVQFPLPINLGLAAQRKAIQSLVGPQIPEHRFDRGKSPAVESPPLLGINRCIHTICIAQGVERAFRSDEATLLPVLLRMQCRLGSGFQLLSLPYENGADAALGLGGVAGEMQCRLCTADPLHRRKAVLCETPVPPPSTANILQPIKTCCAQR